MLTNYSSARPARIILAEDDRIAARLIEIALKRTGIPHDLEVVTVGTQAINLLDKPASLATDAPDLLLLDLHMPGKNGFEVLEHVKRRAHLRRIPVVMLSTSTSSDDIGKAYDLHVNAYVTKHTDFGDLSRALDSIVDFWLRTAAIPSGPCPL